MIIYWLLKKTKKCLALSLHQLMQHMYKWLDWQKSIKTTGYDQKSVKNVTRVML